ncbi:hypothetical protein D3C73_1501110 [compost metagenome]
MKKFVIALGMLALLLVSPASSFAAEAKALREKQLIVSLLILCMSQVSPPGIIVWMPYLTLTITQPRLAIRFMRAPYLSAM